MWEVDHRSGRERLEGARRERWVEDLVEAYEDGAAVRELAQWAGLSYGVTHRLLTEGNVRFRKRGTRLEVWER